MRLELVRISHDAESTIGQLYINGSQECFTVEDQPQKTKVYGETRIPAGTYQIKLRTVGGFHERYLKKYGPEFHHGMLWLQDVPGFEYILIHQGNTDDDSHGCVLVGEQAVMNGRGGGSVARSADAYRKVYARVAHAILGGESVEIQVIDD